MSNSADGFRDEVKKELRDEVGKFCSAPFCGVQTVFYDRITRRERFTGDAAHICGSRPGSARHLDLPDGVGRHSYENGIWLCPLCHRMIDISANLYPSEMLRNWKEAAIQAHEEGSRRRTFATSQIDIVQAHKRASDFLDETLRIREMFREAAWYVPRDQPFRSMVQLTNEFTWVIRKRAGLPASRSWNAYHPHWPFASDFQSWQNEIVRLAGCLADLPAFRPGRDPQLDFHHTIDEDGNTVFLDESTRAVHAFVQMLDRFGEFLMKYDGQSRHSY